MINIRPAVHHFSTLVHILLCTALWACGEGQGARGRTEGGAGTQGDQTKGRSGSDRRAPRGTAFRVALLTPGPISDQSWNGGAYQGLLRVRGSLGAQVSHIQTRTPAEFEENFRQYGAQ